MLDYFLFTLLTVQTAVLRYSVHTVQHPHIDILTDWKKGKKNFRAEDMKQKEKEEMRFIGI